MKKLLSMFLLGSVTLAGIAQDDDAKAKRS